MLTWRRLPFSLHKSEDFKTQAFDWIGDAFYEKLPELGYETREEQIFTAFHMATAFMDKQILFAEAGLGTGKTFAYLLGAVLYARFAERPVVVACGSNSLVEQLMRPGGDLEKLSTALQLDIDARAALDQTYYLCARKVEELKMDPPDLPGLAELLDWADTTKLGARAEVPHVSDELWELVGADVGLDCSECGVSFRCPAFRARDYYRKAADLLICTHAFYFTHIWMRETLQEQGHLPLLPAYSAVVFDEAHRVEDTARRALGARLTLRMLTDSIERLQAAGMRESFAKLLETALETAGHLFDYLEAQDPPPFKKTAVQKSGSFLAAVQSLRSMLAVLMDELSIEEGLTNYTQAEYSMERRAVWANLNQVESVLDALLKERQDRVVWLEKGMEEADGLSLWVAPYQIEQQMQAEVYKPVRPVVFSSATLAHGTSFAYMKRALGAPNAAVSQTASPYEYASQCLVYLPRPAENGLTTETDREEDLAQRIAELLHVSNGRALVLFQDFRTMDTVRAMLKKRLPNPPWPILWEGDGSAAHLLSQFAADVSSVLVGVSFWEGISVVGPALSHCIIAELPFPFDDPIIEAKRKHAQAEGQDPFETVDVPEMWIKLKQGAGRLIRSRTDRGVISCLDTGFPTAAGEPEILAAFPPGARVSGVLEDVANFFKGTV